MPAAAGGDALAARLPTSPASAASRTAQRLRSLAATIEHEVEQKRDPTIGRQRPTGRRARIAEGMMREAEGDLKAQRRLAQAGISSATLFDAARAALAELGTPPRRVADGSAAVAALERDLLGCTIPGFFPTPAPVVEQLLAHAGLQAGQRVLEPSAGKGNIADELRRHAGLEVDVVEVAPRLQEILRVKGHNLVAEDFLTYHETYDRIVMNPPFERLQDVDHVLHAYTLLRPGGRLVSVMGASAFFHASRKAVEFRAWLNKAGAYHERLPEGSFLASERSTGVNTYLVVVNKPDEGRPRLGSKLRCARAPPACPTARPSAGIRE